MFKKTMHQTATIEEINDKLHVVIQPQIYEAIVKSEYLPVGNLFVFPKKWGRKRGAIELINKKIKDNEKLIEDAKHRLVMLTDCLNRVNEWTD
jgi:uncharacterized coiled-coil protein SlyX